MDMVADNSNCALEVSRASATELAVNGAQQCIAVVGQYGNLVTSGVFPGGINVFLPVDVPVDQGQIVYLHALITTCTYYAEIILHIV